ncbi:hypothetical protein Tco_0116597 [Tanacetum coccineum]
MVRPYARGIDGMKHGYYYINVIKSTDVMVLVLRGEKKLSIIEQLIPSTHVADSEAQVLAKWNAVNDAHNEVACLMFGSMTPELHRLFKNSSPYDMLQELKSVFEKQARVEWFDLIQTFHACKQEEGKLVSAYVPKINVTPPNGAWTETRVRGSDAIIYITQDTKKDL